MLVSIRITAVLIAALGICGICLGNGSPATRPPTTQPKTLAELKKENEEMFAAQWRGLTPLGPLPTAQIVHFSVEHDRLKLDSTQSVVDGVQYVVSLSDMPCKAIFRTVTAKGSFPGFRFISFNTWDFSDPALIDRHIQILNSPNNLQVVQDIEYLDQTKAQRTVSMTLMQQADPRASDQVVLRVQRFSEDGPGMSVDMMISAPSFMALRSEHPAEFEQYVRPVFGAMRQDPVVLGVDPRAAWQVLGDTAKSSPDVASKVAAVLAQFNADDFSTRAAAEKQLQALGEPAALYLMSIDRSKLSPEQKARCDKFLATYHPLTDEQAREFRTDVNFLLDCLYSDDAAERTAALEHLGRAVRTNVSFDVNAPPEQRIAAIAQLRKQLSPTAPTGPADK